MLKKGIVGLTLGLGLTLIGQSALAAEHEEIKVKIKTSPSTVNLDWNDQGKLYQLFDNDKKIWEGEDSKFTIDSLESDNQYSYILKSLDGDGVVTDEVSIRTKTKKGLQNVSKNIKSNLRSFNEKDTRDITSNNSELNNITVNSTLNGTNLTIDWDGNIPDDDNRFDVYKNGEKIDSISGNEYEDNNLESNKEYLYEFVGNKRLPEEKIKEIKDDLQSKGKVITPEIENELFYDTYSLTRTISTKSNIQSRAIAGKYTLRYTTFIPMKYADNPFAVVAETQYFNGNNRSFDPFASSFKTRMDVAINFPASGNGSATLPSGNKQVGTTYYYDKNYKQIGSATASNSGMNIRDSVGTVGKVSYNAYHDIGIPYLNAMTPDITWSYNAQIYRDGTYTINGSHDKAPSHEIYLFVPGTTQYMTVHRKEHVDFYHLSPVYPNYSINASY